MQRIERAFQTQTKQAALIPFLTAGDPDLDTSLSAFDAVIAAGADIVEIGIPYSDPLADGPVIQAAALRSLQSGFILPMAFDVCASLRRRHERTGLVLFSYINPVLQYGPERFFRDARAAGADGVILPDLPLEESAPLRELADAADIALIPLVAPTSGEERIEQICAHARGFVYCVSSLGVTGERATLSNRVQELVATVKRHSQLPAAVGFGVSTPQQAQEVAAYADGVIVGSAFVRRVEEALAETRGAGAPVIIQQPEFAGVRTSSRQAVVEQVSSFAAELASALARPQVDATQVAQR
ncbi:MAG: tryptophan synthase subunit alpha [Alicyclobacillus herbarius]|uniref:tryptophan synthase subunit alpha n=1 Tax=Alicyclobacillus herbarius TaxID=122960 RepID=UPI002355C055|nr:tryptophan synthase subunit alpha [Alicyclobacillus herbarius]MCL6632864.1 tryptophan synthase subunit alpha [Alicyclobacillus herbarius]